MVKNMNSLFIRILILASLVCIAMTTVQAAEVHLEDGKLVATGVDDSLGLGAFDIVLTYDNDVTIDSVDGLSGFMVVANVKNEEGTAVVAGISTEGLTGTIPVATVKRSGTGMIDTTVRMLANTKGDPITFTNSEFSDELPTQQPSSSGSKTEAAPITTSGSGEAAPTQTAEASREQGQPEVPSATQAVTTTGTPVTTKATDFAKTGESNPLETPKAALPAFIAVVSFLTVIVLKRKTY